MKNTELMDVAIVSGHLELGLEPLNETGTLSEVARHVCAATVELSQWTSLKDVDGLFRVAVGVLSGQYEYGSNEYARIEMELQNLKRLSAALDGSSAEPWKFDLEPIGLMGIFLEELEREKQKRGGVAP